MDKGAWLVLGGAALVVMIGGSMRTQGTRRANPRTGSRAVVRSTQELLPAFRDKIAELIELMHQDGFDALVFETWRSPERIAELVQKGTGAADSLHGYRAAADVIDAHLMWDAKPAFWQALHRHALALGLGRVRRKESDGVVRWDLPHVQALPGQFDGQVRALLADDARNDLLLEHYTA